MKDGIGDGYTRKDHSSVSNQLFASYAQVQEIRSLASVIGEDELTAIDRTYIEFGHQFEIHFINQGSDINRSILETLDLGWDLLSILPKNELNRIDDDVLNEHYSHERAIERFNLVTKPIIKGLKGSESR